MIAAGAALALLAGVADSGWAQSPIPFGSAPSPRTLPRPSQQDDAHRARQAGQIKPFGEIQSVVQSQLGARVVGVDLREEPGRRFIYHVKAVDRYGRLLAVAVDANTARILSVRGAGG